MHQFVVKIVQIQRSAKLNTMGCTERTAHCGHISLAEVVALFSRQKLRAPILALERGSCNAAIKPKAIAVATEGAKGEG